MRPDLGSILYIPTNRPAHAAIRDALLECRWATRRPGGATLFCLIENQLDVATSADHRRFLEHEAAAAAVPWLHLDECRAKVFVEAVLKHTLADESSMARLRSLLLPPGISYGRGPNLATLLGAALGPTITHRRDSDVYLDGEYLESKRPSEFPIGLELQVIERPLRDLHGTVRRIDELEGTGEAVVRIVGTSSFGSATFDRRDLLSAGREFLVAFQRLGRPAADDDEVTEEVVDYFLREPDTRYDEDFFEIDIDNRVEMEACCFSSVTRLLPEMPTDIIGCDYMAKDLVWRARDGLVFHSRKMHHVYSPDREAHEDLDTHIAYVLRDVQYLQFGRLWQLHTANMENFWAEHRGIGCFDAAVYARSFLDAATASSDELVQVRVGAERVMREAADASKGALGVRLRAVAEAIADSGLLLDAHVRDAVNDYCFLVPKWSSIVNAAKNVELPVTWIE